MLDQNKNRITAREAALKALVRVEQDQAYLNLALPALLRQVAAGERPLAVRLAGGTLQRLNTIDWALGLCSRRSLSSLTPWVRNLLRIGAYQLLYLDRIPAYAAVDETVKLARRYGHGGVAGLSNAVLRRLSRERDALPWPDPGPHPQEYLSLKHSYPHWLVSRVIDRFGFKEAEKWCQANNEVAPLSIRPHSLRITPSELILRLRSENIEAVESPLVQGSLRIKAGFDIARSKAFEEGLFTIQGESSTLVAPLLELKQGDTVIDLCSAPGGKTTHLAELIGDRGIVYAVELNRSRLRLVEKASRRLGLKSIKALLADGRAIDQEYITIPDAVLVDAPCSGLGVLRRLPEIKWRRREADLIAMQKLQVELLMAAASILPVGGKILYSVCTAEPEETEQVAAVFNRVRKDFGPEPLVPLLGPELQEEQDHADSITFWPHRHGLDGFFISLWRKKS